MARVQPTPAMVIRHMPLSRGQRLARTRVTALVVIGAIAVSGALLQELQLRASMTGRGIDVATAPVPPGPFDYFPG